MRRLKKSWLRIFAAAAIFSLLFVFVGCSSNSSSSSTKKETTSGKKVEIVFWHRMTGPWKTALDQEISDFNKSQDKYEVKGITQGSIDQLKQKVMAAARSKTLPTITQLPYTSIPDYIKQGMLEEVSFTSDQKSDMYPAILSSTQYQGKSYSVPFADSTQLLFINDQLAKKYNLETPTSWEQVKTIGEQLKKDGIYAMSLDQSYDMPLESMANQAGYPYVTKDGKANLSKPEVIAAAQMILDLKKDGYLKTAAEDQYGSVAMLNNKAVYGIGSSANIGEFKNRAKSGQTFSTAAIPSYKGKSGDVISANNLVLFKSASADQKKGAKEFFNFMLKPKQAAYWAEKSGYVPMTKSAMKYKTYQDYLAKNPSYKAVETSIENAYASNQFAGYDNFRTKLLSAVDSTLTANASADKAFTSLQTETQQILQQNK
ncbi:extracellular solute-binding protein [Xylocopilactobacillus apicola]|uniref:ABC transporter substrate-binding protein n=1 Tax=Xylocopilactobacillus apicola TaxID=2932184 RepID=A0AAU9DHY2_9LACO|nr:extracellular solute-binding protein [Xylocopilactobacillus apicola]BDR59670.1 ABC transporter substrate-binding protein [Xylocopilactobacillus apicola]